MLYGTSNSRRGTMKAEFPELNPQKKPMRQDASKPKRCFKKKPQNSQNQSCELRRPALPVLKGSAFHSLENFRRAHREFAAASLADDHPSLGVALDKGPFALRRERAQDQDLFAIRAAHALHHGNRAGLLDRHAQLLQ